MKRNKLLVLALLVAMTSFSACTNDAEEVLTQENEIKLTSEITASRVASLDYQSTQIVKGQLVGVTITGAKSEHKNVAWNVGEEGELSNTGDPVYYGDGAATITAYHPFNDDWDENYTFSVSADQTDAANYLNSDLLWATATSSKTETAVPLIFSHMLAKINVTLVPEKNGDDLNGATISIYNTKISTTFNPTTGVISDATGEAQEIIAGVTADDVYTASAIVVPQTVAGGTKFIKVNHNGKTFYYTLTADKELKSGYSHNYTLTVKEKAIEVKTESEITDWNDEGLTGNAEEEVAVPYLTFKANAEQTLTMSKAVATLEYSVNGGEWKTLGTTTVTFGDNNGYLKLRGKSSSGTANNYSDYAHIKFGTAVDVACSGDIRTLIDYENYTTAQTSNARFRGLFKNCTSLTQAPELPATTLADYCYSYMFYNCTSLTTAPELPATTLADYCYDGMFWGTSLTQAPELPATTLAKSCYNSMFYNCTSLTTAPELPATTLADYCYNSMFYGCKSLTHAPKLPATTLNSYCYSCMFSRTSLTQAPELPATTLADYCYSSMFWGTSLTQAPELPATTLADYCYYEMFSECTNLTQAPELPATTLADYCYSDMFNNCKNLQSITMLATDISATYCLASWVNGVASTGTFIKAKEMTSLPEGSNGIPKGWTVKDKE